MIAKSRELAKKYFFRHAEEGCLQNGHLRSTIEAKFNTINSESLMRNTKLLFLFIAFISLRAYSLEANWEVLKTLNVDAKTKKTVIPAELKKILDGKEVSIQGFMMPLDFESKEVTEFLLMPYVPSCMHVPPPPPSQLILVKMKKGSKIKPSYYPIELKGKLMVEANPDLESSYKMEGQSFKELKQFTPPPSASPPPGAHP